MKIICFKYGEALYLEKRIFADKTGDNEIPMSFCFYMILTGDKKILVDTGCEAVERYKMYAYKRPVDLIKEYGLSPEDITDVIITHGHIDHVEGINAYKHAKIHIQKDELERAQSYFASDFNFNIFDESTFVCDDVCVKKIGGHTSGSCVVFAGKYILCGDEAYFYKNLTDKVRVGNSYSNEISQQFVEKYSQGQFIPLVFHDGSIMSGKAGFEEIN